jgi:hypothetical protein
MSDPLTIVQKKFSETLTFRFEDERLVRTHADASGANELAIYYNLIDVQNWTTVAVDKLKPHRYAIWAVCVFGAAGAASGMAMPQRAFCSFVGLIAFGLAIAQRRKWIAARYTLYRLIEPATATKFIKVLEGPDHDRIIAELKARWRTRWRRLAAQVDIAADPAKEQRKFEWLRDNGVIDAAECRRAFDLIRAAREGPARMEYGPLN